MIESLRRHIMMQQGGTHYNVDWYPIFQGVPLKDLIAEFGDLMQTFDNDSNWAMYKCAFAIARNTQSITVGTTGSLNITIYEEGQEPIRVTQRNTTINFSSTTTYKHVVSYSNRMFGGCNVPVCWLINYNVVTFGTKENVFFLHVPKFHPECIINTSSNNIFYLGRAGCTFYIPDWSNTGQTFFGSQVSKIRFSKDSSVNGGTLSFGSYSSGIPQNLTDIYAHWGLGEVITQPSNRNTGLWKLHIPDLGKAEDNAALRQEYIDKGWGYVSGLGIFNDVETTEPREQLE